MLLLRKWQKNKNFSKKVMITTIIVFIPMILIILSGGMLLFINNIKYYPETKSPVYSRDGLLILDKSPIPVVLTDFGYEEETYENDTLYTGTYFASELTISSTTESHDMTILYHLFNSSGGFLTDTYIDDIESSYESYTLIETDAAMWGADEAYTIRDQYIIVYKNKLVLVYYDNPDITIDDAARVFKEALINYD
jgi:hypothetical protein